MKKLDPCILHLIRNAIDHGIESPEEREKVNKGAGNIHLSIQVLPEQIRLRISDDGKGIDGDKLTRLAIVRGFISEEEANRLTEEDKIKLIFHPGFSTKDNVSEISGRGMGMHAVQTQVEELEGTIELETKVGQGLSVTLNLPKTIT